MWPYKWRLSLVQFLTLAILSLAMIWRTQRQTFAEESNLPGPTPDAYKQYAEEIERHFTKDILPFWFPRCLDQDHGGFRSQFLSDGTLGRGNAKTIVFQSRMTWVAAEVVQRYPELAETYRGYVRHGLTFLRDVMWDREYGGFYWGLTEDGQFVPNFGQEKHLYGISFGLYAAANAYRATGDARALELAQATFLWLEKHARDRDSGGYWEAFARDGTPITVPPPAGSNGRTNPQRDLLGTPYGYKSMNSHIHILEALTELHRVWPSQEVTERLQEIFLIVRDKIAVEPGCLNLYFTPDWRAVPDHDSFGHDVETAYLLLEAAERLHLAGDPRTRGLARSLVDHALEYGWDNRLGGFYDKGTAFGRAYGLDKIWWTQAEGLNALLLMHELFGAENQQYWAAFCKQWEFIKKYQINTKAGEWYDTVSPEGQPVLKDLGHIWKAAYHNGRALMESVSRLRRLAGENAAGP